MHVTTILMRFNAAAEVCTYIIYPPVSVGFDATNACMRLTPPSNTFRYSLFANAKIGMDDGDGKTGRCGTGGTFNVSSMRCHPKRSSCTFDRRWNNFEQQHDNMYGVACGGVYTAW